MTGVARFLNHTSATSGATTNRSTESDYICTDSLEGHHSPTLGGEYRGCEVSTLWNSDFHSLARPREAKCIFQSETIVGRLYGDGKSTEGSKKKKAFHLIELV